jgi:uncharacterized protein
MKLQPDDYDVQTINGHGAGWVQLGAERIDHSVIVGARGEREAWNCATFEALTAEHFAHLATFDAEVMLFGSGLRNRFVPAQWLRPLIERGIGLETMDTAAACRTYNVLAGEGRRVVTALLLEAPETNRA